MSKACIYTEAKPLIQGAIRFEFMDSFRVDGYVLYDYNQEIIINQLLETPVFYGYGTTFVLRINSPERMSRVASARLYQRLTREHTNWAIDGF